jgi:hypothetical protein
MLVLAVCTQGGSEASCNGALFARWLLNLYILFAAAACAAVQRFGSSRQQCW